MVGESTLRRWLSPEAFQTAYLAARRDMVQHAMTQIQQAGSQAVATLVSVMESPYLSARARVAAAKVVLETALKAGEREEVEACLAKLEAQQLDTPGKP